MTRASSVIEINGSRYDAVTGQLIGKAKTVAHQVTKAPAGVVDGITRHLPAAPAIRKQAKPRVAPARRSESASSIHQRTQHSKTLMRNAVAKKPAADQPAVAKSKKVNPSRASRASMIIKDARVNRFGHAKTATGNDFFNPKTASVGPAASASSTAVAKRSVTDLPAQQLERLLDHALMRADAHKQALHSGGRSKKLFGGSPKWASMGAILAAFVLLAGFFAWQNIPQVSMKVASSRASIPGSLPEYTPPGFKFAGPISSSNETVTIKFKANSDEGRVFSISQQKSDWDSQTLAANTIPAGSSVQTSQVKRTTVYIYGYDNHATWVNQGVRYTLNDRANLNSDQIIKIAASL